MLTAIITGASRGIGKAVALRLAQEGFEVALIARNKIALSLVKQEIENAGGTAIAIPCDVTKFEEVQKSIQLLQARWSHLDVLFNNAGIAFGGTTDVETTDFVKIFEVNVFGAFYILKAIVPWLKDKAAEGGPFGTIINLASVRGITGAADVGAYSSSKFALRGLNESLHYELEPLGIRVTAISPSWVNTDMAEHCPYPRNEILQPEDIAEAVMYVHRLPRTISMKELVLGCRQDLE